MKDEIVAAINKYRSYHKVNPLVRNTKVILEKNKSVLTYNYLYLPRHSKFQHINLD